MKVTVGRIKTSWNPSIKSIIKPPKTTIKSLIKPSKTLIFKIIKNPLNHQTTIESPMKPSKTDHQTIKKRTKPGSNPALHHETSPIKPPKVDQQKHQKLFKKPSNIVQHHPKPSKLPRLTLVSSPQAISVCSEHPTADLAAQALVRRGILEPMDRHKGQKIAKKKKMLFFPSRRKRSFFFSPKTRWGVPLSWAVMTTWRPSSSAGSSQRTRRRRSRAWTRA